MILIIANARIKGGLSGSDNIYLNMTRHAGHHRTWEMMDTDFRPFVLCYIWKIVKACWCALWDFTKYEFVYSASDFWMDSLPALILKLKGNKWVAGFYLFAPRDTFIYYWSQKITIWIINKFADVVCVTNESMFNFDKPMIAVHGGVDLKLAYPSNDMKIFDAVFIGRLHYTKGIDELMRIWDGVLKIKPKARLAVIGDGDTEVEAFKKWLDRTSGVTWFGFLGEDRFDVYRKSKMVLYTTPHCYSHFSMGPVEAMACGCPMVAFDIPVMADIKPEGCEICVNRHYFVRVITRGSMKSREATTWARTWDWSTRAPKILKEIREKLCES